jgi:MFS family permease
MMKQSLYYLTSSIFVLYWGRLSDRIGRKPIIMIGLIGMVLSGILFGKSHSFITLILSRAVEGALNGNSVTIRTAIGEIVEESQVARVFPYMTSTWFVGTIIGSAAQINLRGLLTSLSPMIGGYLSHPADRIPLLFGNEFWRSNPYLLPCAVAALYSTGCLLIVSIRLREVRDPVQCRSS